LTATNTPNPELFDPPFGIKVFDAHGLPVLRWTMVWINNSNTVAVNAMVSDPISAGTVYVATGAPSGYGVPAGAPAGSTSVGVACQADLASVTTTTTLCYYEGPTVTFPLGRIVWQGVLGPDLGATSANDANNEIVIAFNVTVNSGITSVVNSATIDSDRNGDSDTLDNGEQQVASAQAQWSAPTANVATNTPVPVLVDPLITKRVNLELAQAGDLVEYSITVTNSNSVALANVVVTDTLSALLDFVNGSASQGTFAYDASSQSLTFNIGALNAGQSATLTIAATVNNNGKALDKFCNVAQAQADGRSAASNEVCSQISQPISIPNTGVGPGGRELPLTVLLWLLAGSLPLVAWLGWRRWRAWRTQIK
jgi:uncharacterized repeat protein (TIGR01451 family)